MNNPDQSNNPGSNINYEEKYEDPETTLFKFREKKAKEKLKDFLLNLDSDIAPITAAVLNRHYFDAMNDKLIGKLNRLKPELDDLKKKVNTPEIQDKSEAIIKQIDIILKKQAELKKELDIEHSRRMISRASDSQLVRANLLVDRIVSDVELTVNPESELN